MVNNNWEKQAQVHFLKYEASSFTFFVMCKMASWFGNKENEAWPAFPWLPVNATLVVWSAEELHLFKGNRAGKTAGNGRVEGEKGVECSTSCMTSE